MFPGTPDWVVLAVLGIVIVLVGWKSLPRLWLDHQLAPFWDGIGFTRTVTKKDRDGKSNSVHVRPKTAGRKRTESGYLFHVRLKNGNTLAALADKADAMADHLGLVEVQIKPSGKPGRALVLAYKRDPAPEQFSLADLGASRK